MSDAEQKPMERDAEDEQVECDCPAGKTCPVKGVIDSMFKPHYRGQMIELMTAVIEHACDPIHDSTGNTKRVKNLKKEMGVVRSLKNNPWPDLTGMFIYSKQSSQFLFKNMGNETSRSNIHVANATGKNLRIFYEVDKMRLEELVINVGEEIGSSWKISTNAKMVFKPDSWIRYLRLPKYETCNFAGEGTLYASVLVEDENDDKTCIDVICLNYHIPSDRSFIVTANHNIKLQKYGASIWVDEGGINHHP